MVVNINRVSEPCLVGTRMNAEEFLALPPSSQRYELVDGVVIMSPSASFAHQDIVGEILFQLRTFLAAQPLGKAVSDVDVRLRADLVYRPDIVYLSMEKATRTRAAAVERPELVVEIVSPGARLRDEETKRRDYEAAGIAEYWLIDPQSREMLFFGLTYGRYQTLTTDDSRFASTVLPGFTLRLDAIRALF